MSPHEFEAAMRKALEEWSLQNMVDGAIIASFLALGAIVGRAYLDGIKSRLSLRVAIEVWDVISDVLADVFLLFAAIVGVLTINPDIFADIKIALPFCPLAFICLGAALVLRLFHGGAKVGSRAWIGASGLVVIGALLNWFGFTFVMEAAGHEWLDNHPSATWEALRAMRSNLNPELSMTTFLWTQPAMFAIFVWAIIAGAVQTWRRYAGRAAGAQDGNASRGGGEQPVCSGKEGGE